jgi:predicted nucleic acid-binding protein
MSFYLDTNVIYSFIFADAHTVRIYGWLQKQSAVLLIGDFVQTEFHALVGRRARGGGLTAHDASVGVADFDAFVAGLFAGEAF